MLNDNSFDPRWMKRTRWLTHALILSGTLNIGLLAAFASFILKEKHHPVALELKPLIEDGRLKKKSPTSNESILRSYSLLSFQDLIFKLDDKELVDDGYAKRDLALSCLVAFHHFNLDRALGGLLLQKRQIFFSNLDGDEKIDLVIFPGLADYQYQAILHYAKTEKWPFTSQGLFYEIKAQNSPRELTLLNAFYLTPEFHAAYTLISRTGVKIDKESLVDMLAQGEWGTLSEFSMQQRQVQDLSPNRCRQFLFDYLQFRSSLAAKILLENDREFVSKRFDDAQVLLILNLASEKIPVLEAFCKELLLSPRSDEVLKAAAVKLYHLAGEALPDPYNHSLVLRRFFPEREDLPAETLPEPIKPTGKTEILDQVLSIKPKRIHVVQPGENLWKISRKYRVPIEDIMKANRLETERIRPGRQLEIPGAAP